jgi:hypothetical protein
MPQCTLTQHNNSSKKVSLDHRVENDCWHQLVIPTIFRWRGASFLQSLKCYPAPPIHTDTHTHNYRSSVAEGAKGREWDPCSINEWMKSWFSFISKTAFRTRGVAQTVQHLPSKHEKINKPINYLITSAETQGLHLWSAWHFPSGLEDKEAQGTTFTFPQSFWVLSSWQFLCTEFTLQTRMQ